MARASAARAAWSLAAAVALSGCAIGPTRSPSPADPYEVFNRHIYKINVTVDRAVTKPIAVAYKKVTPQPIRTGIGNFVDNLKMPGVMINDFLQGKFRAAASDAGRFLLDTTLGVAGIFDVATKANIDHNDADFGQTLGVWGVGPGYYLMLPVFGPSTFRDAPGKVVDAYLNPAAYANAYPKYGYEALNLLDTRYQLLKLDPTLDQAFDPYTLLRNSYLQRRAYAISGGKTQDEPLQDPDADADAPAAPPPSPPAPKP